MELKFRDFYGQHVCVHDQTSSGNIRIQVNTMKDLCEVRRKKADECDTETDISLDYHHLDVFIEALLFARETARKRDE